MGPRRGEAVGTDPVEGPAPRGESLPGDLPGDWSRRFAGPPGDRHPAVRSEALQRPQEVEEILLLAPCEGPELIDHTVGLRSRALMLTDCGEQIGRPPVVQEEDALTESPQRRTPELIDTRVPLA